jgi:hypothetical protein
MNERIKELLAELDIDLYTDEGVMMTKILVRPKDLRQFAELIGRDMLKLVNRHGNIKNHSINEYFGFEKDFGINTNNIKRFVNERTN